MLSLMYVVQMYVGMVFGFFAYIISRPSWFSKS